MKIFTGDKNIRYGAVVFFLVSFIFEFGIISVSADTVSNSACPYVWSRNLKVGSQGNDVLKLQQFLNADSDTAVALSGVGSQGKEGNYYGLLTKQAVVKFQEKYSDEILLPAGLSSGTGVAGVGTRTKLNAFCSAPISADNFSPSLVKDTVTVSTTATTLSSLVVSRPDQPARTIAPANAGWVPFTNITLTAGDKDVTVKNFVIERVGIGADGAFYSIALTDEDGNQIGKASSLNSNHKVVLGDPFVIPAGISKTFSIVGNMASDLTDYDGQEPTFQVNSIDTSAVVSGQFPVKGTAQAVNNNFVIGTGYMSISSFDPNTSTTRYINDTGVRFSGVRISADSQEDLSLSSFGWYQSGSASNNDLANVVTVVGGNSYPTEIKDRLFTSVFDPPIVIKKGQSVELYVQGDILPGAVNRTVEFDVQTSDDIALAGLNCGFYVSILPESNTAVSGNSVFITSDGTIDGDSGTPFFAGSVVTVSGGAFTDIGKSSGQ